MYNYLWYFVIYAFAGWCTEVCYAAIKQKRFVNRGFLSGAVCPIYGFGIVGVVLCLTPIKDNLFLLFIGSVLLTSALEFATGFFMKALFHSRWWDYSNEKYNLSGYICLKFSLIWGVACVIVVAVIHPLITKLILIIPRFIAPPIVLILIAVIAADAVYTIIGVNKLNKKLRQMEEFTSVMRKLSNKIGENVAENTIAIIENTERLKTESEKAFSGITQKNEQRIHELQQKIQKLLEKNTYTHRRLLHAFPNFKSERYTDALEDLKERLKKAAKIKFK